MKISHRASIFLLLISILYVVSLGCGPGGYQIGEECCVLCPSGTRVIKHCSEISSTMCWPCDNGTFMDKPTELTQCLPCRTCDEGCRRKDRSCSATSNALCEPLDGFFCTESLKEGNCGKSRKHKECSAGEYVAQRGSAFADTECAPCAEGTFSNGTECHPHTQCELLDKDTLKSGTFSSDAECGEKVFPLTAVIEIVMVAVVIIGLLAILVIYCKKILKKLIYKKIQKNNNNNIGNVI